ncbi:septal ring lytic transglycosylase RlpA family protein [Curvibacter sp. HBC28]|uniref:Endolytic peptidoglycan transglycosylase RlpA n=1 Tax=Curvibacter microcysteis TaxID=3026419 RepID=A0ABT5MM93_9BURK|nr:septal ring lytic transglycosylase RlpA family protein [Curvibacter sp. HBC28]MDD0816974.1 septal ring lytic transglycosylase RlpA family protein [Curvibacter sp. HBC28]
MRRALLGWVWSACVLLSVPVAQAAETGFGSVPGLSLPTRDQLDEVPASGLPPEPLGDPLSTLMSPDEVFFERGAASWYGLALHRRRTASGERFDMNAMTAAHRTLPFGSRVCVHSLVTGKEVLVRINDRGPHTAGRIIDLSRAAALALDLLGTGIKEVALSLPTVTGRACGS